MQDILVITPQLLPSGRAAVGCASVPFGFYPEGLPSVSCLFPNLVIPVGLLHVITIKSYVNLEMTGKTVGSTFKLNALEETG